jgi:hypothetical protein
MHPWRCVAVLYAFMRAQFESMKLKFEFLKPPVVTANFATLFNALINTFALEEASFDRSYLFLNPAQAMAIVVGARDLWFSALQECVSQCNLDDLFC